MIYGTRWAVWTSTSLKITQLHHGQSDTTFFQTGAFNVLLLFMPVRRRGVYIYCIYNCVYHRWFVLLMASPDSLFQTFIFYYKK